MCPSLCPRIWDETTAVLGPPVLVGPGSVCPSPYKVLGEVLTFSSEEPTVETAAVLRGPQTHHGALHLLPQ